MAKQERQSFWTHQLEQLRTSGLSAQRFAQQHNLSYHQLIYWRSKLSTASNLSTPASAGFAKVTALRTDELLSDSGLRLHLPGGLSLTGIDHGNLDLVLSMLRQL
jgi:hypothetical protein